MLFTFHITCSNSYPFSSFLCFCIFFQTMMLINENRELLYILLYNSVNLSILQTQLIPLCPNLIQIFLSLIALWPNLTPLTILTFSTTFPALTYFWSDKVYWELRPPTILYTRIIPSLHLKTSGPFYLFVTYHPSAFTLLASSFIWKNYYCKN